MKELLIVNKKNRFIKLVLQAGIVNLAIYYRLDEGCFMLFFSCFFFSCRPEPEFNQTLKRTGVRYIYSL